jgi:hypothetical protein
MDDLVELAFRSSGEIEVSLFWTPKTNGVQVQVVDWQRDEAFTVDVEPGSALDAFHHPYAYAELVAGDNSPHAELQLDESC